MSASSSDSWILIALTVLVVLVLFYLSKKMICSLATATERSGSRYRDSNGEMRRTYSIDAEITSQNERTIDDANTPINIIATPEFDRKNLLESQLRIQIIRMLQAEREIKRLASLLSDNQGISAIDYISTLRNDLYLPSEFMVEHLPPPPLEQTSNIANMSNINNANNNNCDSAPLDDPPSYEDCV